MGALAFLNRFLSAAVSVFSGSDAGTSARSTDPRARDTCVRVQTRQAPLGDNPLLPIECPGMLYDTRCLFATTRKSTRVLRLLASTGGSASIRLFRSNKPPSARACERCTYLIVQAPAPKRAIKRDLRAARQLVRAVVGRYAEHGSPRATEPTDQRCGVELPHNSTLSWARLIAGRLQRRDSTARYPLTR